MINTATLAREAPSNRVPGRSRLTAALRAPWLATSRANVWISAAAFAVCALGASAIGWLLPDRHGTGLALFVYAFGAAFWWAFCMASLLLLARDARHASLPGVSRNTEASIVLYAIVTIVPPVLIAGIFRNQASLAALIMCLAIAAAVAFMLLPRFVGVLIGLAPALYLTLRNLHAIPSLFDPRLEAWGVVALVVLVIYDLGAWRHLLRSEAFNQRGRSNPMIVFMRMNAIHGGWAAMDCSSLTKSSSKDNARINLRGISIHTPIKTIGVALSGFLVPRTLKGNLIRAGQALWIVPFFGISLLPGIASHKHHLVVEKLAGIAVLGGLGWLVMFAALMTPFLGVMLLMRRWSRGGELALLAHLPGLDREAPAYASVVRAILVKPLAMQAIAAAFAIVCVLLVHARAVALILPIVLFAAIALATAWALLRIVGGRPPRTWILVVLAVIGFAITTMGIPLVVMTIVPTSGPIWTTLAWGFDAVLFGACAAFILPTLRAWRTFKRRPHPFLANAR